MNDPKPIYDDTAFIWLHAVRGMTPAKITSLIDYGLAVHTHRNGPPVRFEIASSKLTKKQQAAIFDHVAKLGLPFDGFNDLTTARRRREAFPPLGYSNRSKMPFYAGDEPS